MSKANNLGDFLTDVADAIRTKNGTTGQINAQNFSNLIKQDGMLTIRYKLDGTEEGWSLYKHETLNWAKWGEFQISNEVQPQTSINQTPYAKSTTYKPISIEAIGVESTAVNNNCFAIGNPNKLLIRFQNSVAIGINTLDDFKAYLRILLKTKLLCSYKYTFAKSINYYYYLNNLNILL